MFSSNRVDNKDSIQLHHTTNNDEFLFTIGEIRMLKDKKHMFEGRKHISLCFDKTLITKELKFMVDVLSSVMKTSSINQNQEKVKDEMILKLVDATTENIYSALRLDDLSEPHVIAPLESLTCGDGVIIGTPLNEAMESDEDFYVDMDKKVVTTGPMTLKPVPGPRVVNTRMPPLVGKPVKPVGKPVKPVGKEVRTKWNISDEEAKKHRHIDYDDIKICENKICNPCGIGGKELWEKYVEESITPVEPIEVDAKISFKNSGKANNQKWMEEKRLKEEIQEQIRERQQQVKSRKSNAIKEMKISSVEAYGGKKDPVRNSSFNNQTVGLFVKKTGKNSAKKVAKNKKNSKKEQE